VLTVKLNVNKFLAMSKDQLLSNNCVVFLFICSIHTIICYCCYCRLRLQLATGTVFRLEPRDVCPRSALVSWFVPSVLHNRYSKFVGGP